MSVPSPQGTLRVVIAEDSGLLREALARVLASAGLDVVAKAEDGPALVRAAEEYRPDVAVVDVRMPPEYRDEGLKAAIEARRRVPTLAVLVLSQYVEERYGAELLRAGSRGTGYLLKDRVADVSDFVAAVRRVASGGTALDPEVVSQLLSRRRDDRLASLTPREREVLSVMAEGRTNLAIARTLFITPGAVEKHIRSIFGKLGLAQTDDDHRRVMAVLAYLRG